MAAVFEAVFLTALLAGAALRATVALGSSVVAELRAATLRVVLASTSLSLRVAAAFCAADLRIACWWAAVRWAGTGAAADSTASTEAPTCEPIFEASLATTSMRLLATFSPSVTAVPATRRPRVTVAVPRSLRSNAVRSPWARRSVTTFSPRAAAASYWSLALLAMTRPSLRTRAGRSWACVTKRSAYVVASFWSSVVRFWRSAMRFWRSFCSWFASFLAPLRRSAPLACRRATSSCSPAVRTVSIAMFAAPTTA